jgi:cytochrome b561
MIDNTSQITKFNPILIVLHWFMLLLIVAVYVFMEFRGIFPKGSEPRELMKALHFMLGMSVFFLVLTRLVVRFSTKVPDILPPPKSIEKLLAKMMHIALYIFMIGMPLLGWLMVSANGKTVPFFGLQLPTLIAENKDLGKLLHEVHEIGASLGYVLLGGHAAAALFHHYVRKDNTLLRMSFLKK